MRATAAIYEGDVERDRKQLIILVRKHDDDLRSIAALCERLNKTMSHAEIGALVGKAEQWSRRLVKWKVSGYVGAPFGIDQRRKKSPHVANPGLNPNKNSYLPKKAKINGQDIDVGQLSAVAREQLAKALNGDDDDEELNDGLADDDDLLNNDVRRNFSANNRGQRKASDFYETPYSITRHLLEREPFDPNLTVCEPASGNGAIVRVLMENRFDKIAFYDIQGGIDFLQDTKQYDYIITNPPFSLAYEFIQKAKEVADRKFAFLLPLSYLHGQQRFTNIYSVRTYGLKKVYVLTRYPLLGDALREDGKYRTGMMVYAWYIWENHYGELPSIDWIDNNADILNANDDAGGEPATIELHFDRLRIWTPESAMADS